MKSLIDVFTIEVLVFVVIILALPLFRKAKNVQKLRKVRRRNHDDEIVIDLKLNNSINSSKGFFVNKLSTAIIVFIVTVIVALVYFAAVSLGSFDIVEFKTGILIAAGLMIFLYLYLYEQRAKFLKRLVFMKKRFTTQDLIFNEIFLEINPFLIGDETYNPDLNNDIHSAEADLKKLGMIRVLWSDIEEIIIDERSNQGRMVYFIQIKAGEKDLYLNRLLFGSQEKLFFKLINQFSSIKVTNNSEYVAGLNNVPKFEYVTLIGSLVLSTFAIFFLFSVWKLFYK